MVTFPNSKINLGLHITSKREDGFHNLETVFYSIRWCDALEVIHTKSSDISLSISGLAVPGNMQDNICVKAWQLLKKDFPELPAIQIHLYKTIPTGAGLGGGSADGAYMLQLLNDKFNLQINHHQLIAYALQLGSDCPFFILNKPCYATERGNKMEALDIDLSAYSFVIVNPGIHIPTGWAFNQLQPATPEKSIREIIIQPIDTWKAELINDFEVPVSRTHPAIGAVKETLYKGGAIYASMTGSGSTVYGIFQKNKIPAFSFPATYIQHLVP